VQRDTGQFKVVTLPSPTTHTVTQYFEPAAHRYRVTAIDGRGTQSASVLGPPAILEARQEAHASIAYTGTWQPQSNVVFFGGSARFASGASARATLSFTGTSVAWVTSRGPSRGLVQIWLDGAKSATLDLYTPTQRNRQIMFARNGLTNSAHTLQIRVLGTHNPASVGNRVDVDVFVVLR
jgi:hypothetical protein